MRDYSEIPRIPIQVTHGCLIASIQVELNDDILTQFQIDLLEWVRRHRARGVILDVSGVDVIDAHEFESLCRTMAMAEVMGSPTMLVGLKPGIVASLVDLGVETAGVRATVDVERALAWFDQTSKEGGNVP